MSDKDNEIKADRAWAKLYRRLDDDGLLNALPIRRRGFRGWSLVGATAAAAFVTALLIGLHTLPGRGAEQLHNEAGRPILVTTRRTARSSGSRKIPR